MTRRQLYIEIATFILGFGVTFYVIKTYFPKHKVENSNTAKDTLTNDKE
ncbi:hypothetical protein [Flavobacterium flavipallidum]|uniref:Cbb3-type cytochrome oxidase component FixQ n=1 Tax=Flavobacterium flavipallidum TaxID=3139140 RepID=A0ABU9HIA0_9FLAO